MNMARHVKQEVSEITSFIKKEFPQKSLENEMLTNGRQILVNLGLGRKKVFVLDCGSTLIQQLHNYVNSEPAFSDVLNHSYPVLQEFNAKFDTWVDVNEENLCDGSVVKAVFFPKKLEVDDMEMRIVKMKRVSRVSNDSSKSKQQCIRPEGDSLLSFDTSPIFSESKGHDYSMPRSISPGQSKISCDMKIKKEIIELENCSEEEPVFPIPDQQVAMQKRVNKNKTSLENETELYIINSSTSHLCLCPGIESKNGQNNSTQSSASPGHFVISSEVKKKIKPCHKGGSKKKPKKKENVVVENIMKPPVVEEVCILNSSSSSNSIHPGIESKSGQSNFIQSSTSPDHSVILSDVNKKIKPCHKGCSKKNTKKKKVVKNIMKPPTVEEEVCILKSSSSSNNIHESSGDICNKQCNQPNECTQTEVPIINKEVKRRCRICTCAKSVLPESGVEAKCILSEQEDLKWIEWSYEDFKPNEKKARLEWGKRTLSRKNWHLMIFADVCQFVLKQNKIKRQPLPLQANIKRALFWGCLALEGPRILETISISSNSRDLIKLMKANFMRHFKQKKDCDLYLHVISDSPKFKSIKDKSFKKFLNKNGINLSFWPPYMRNISPIEHVWKLLANKVKNIFCFTKSEMISVISEVWKHDRDINLMFEKYVSSLPEIMKSMVQQKGCNPINEIRF